MGNNVQGENNHSHGWVYHNHQIQFGVPNFLMSGPILYQDRNHYQESLFSIEGKINAEEFEFCKKGIFN